MSTPNTSMPIMAGLLGLVIVAEAIMLGYVVTRMPNNQQLMNSGSGNEAAVARAPHFYTDVDYPGSSWRYGRNLLMLDPETGEETTVYSVENSYLELVAAPQVGYDERVFISELCDGCDNPYFSLSELNFKTGSKPTKVTALDEYGDILRSAVAVSPDQTKIAFIPHDADAPNGAPLAPAIYTYNLLTGEVAPLGEGRVELGHSFMIRDDSAHSMIGIMGGNMSWKDNSCVITQVYEGPTTRDGVEYVTFCEDAE